MIRRNLVYNIFQNHEEPMLHSSIRAVNVTDKQDPSLVTDISRLHDFLFSMVIPLLDFTAKPSTF
jgi:hypothetical protein